VATLSAVAVVDLQHLTATFDADMDMDSLAGAIQWSITLPAGVVPALVTNAVPRDNSLRIVDLIVGPALTSGQSFDLVASNAETAGGVPLLLVEKTKTFAVPVQDGAMSEWPHEILREWTRLIGEEFQQVAGVASTRLVEAFPSAGGTAFVETTLGFPDTGAFFVGPRKYSYTGRTPVSFTGCTPELVYPLEAMVEWSPVWCDPYAVQLEE